MLGRGRARFRFVFGLPGNDGAVGTSAVALSGACSLGPIAAFHVYSARLVDG